VSKTKSKQVESGPLVPLPAEMTPFERALRAEEAKLVHAVKIGIPVDPDGTRGAPVREHYLTCRKCELRRQLGFPAEDPLSMNCTDSWWTCWRKKL